MIKSTDLQKMTTQEFMLLVKIVREELSRRSGGAQISTQAPRKGKSRKLPKHLQKT